MTDEERDDDLSFVLDYDLRDETDDYYTSLMGRETDEAAREPFWTTRRILLAIILILMLLSLLAYDLWGILQPPFVPTPPPIPRGTPMPII